MRASASGEGMHLSDDHKSCGLAAGRRRRRGTTGCLPPTAPRMRAEESRPAADAHQREAAADAHAAAHAQGRDAASASDIPSCGEHGCTSSRIVGDDMHRGDRVQSRTNIYKPIEDVTM